jgi:hypothetical protein
MFRRLASIVCGLALLSGVALADTTARITIAELRSKGIDTRNFSVFHVAGDGRTVLISDEPDFTVKRKGVLRRLFLVKLTPAMKIESVKKYDLPIPRIEQANFTPDLQSVVISSKRGADIHRLDLADGKLTVLVSHTPGTAGFRIHGDVFSNYAGKLYTVGYFYDENDQAGKDVMVEVNPSMTGKEAFTQLVEIAPIQRQLGGIRIESLLSPQGMLFYTSDKAGAKWAVFRWSPPKGLEKIDESGAVVGTWGEGPLGVYCMKRPGGTEVTLVNAQNGQKTQIYQGPDGMTNPCLSNEGNTVVVSHLNADKTVTFWAAQDTDGFKPRKIAENYWPATTRISHNGQVVCLYQGPSKGLVLIKLEPPK